MAIVYGTASRGREDNPGRCHRGDPRRAGAAQELCDLDDAQQRRVFTEPTRRKLERLLRDKSVDGSNPSSPEAAFIRAAQQLGGFIQRVQVLSPLPTSNPRRATSRSGAGGILTLAAARLRLGGLMRWWDRTGGDVDGLLLHAADDEDLGDVFSCFADAGVAEGAALPPLQLRLHGDDGSTVQVKWKPDLDDVALLRAALLFAEEPALTLALDQEPTLHAFCGPDSAAAHRVPDALVPLARKLRQTARALLDRGVDPAVLTGWTEAWTAECTAREESGDDEAAEALALAGGVRGGDRVAALTGLAPLKAEWLAQYHEVLWSLLHRAEEPGSAIDPADAVSTSTGVARTTAAHHPAHLRLRTQDRALLPTSEGRVWSLYGGTSTRDESGFGGQALSSVITQLLMLQPEAAGHLRCLTWGPGAADLLTGEAVRLIGKKAGRAVVSRVEIFCVGKAAEDKPTWDTLADADHELRGDHSALQLRYLTDLDAARLLLAPATSSPAVHLALVTGLTEGGQRLQIESPEVDPPGEDGEVLFAPRVWQRPRQDRRTLLMPPAASPAGQMWLRLQNAVEDTWPEPEPRQRLRVPEVRTGTLDIASQLRQVHDLALWVATLDRYATRDSLEQ